CLGLAGAALDAAEAAADPVGRRVLAEEFDADREEFDALRRDLVHAVRAVPDLFPRELVQVRLETALLVGRTTRLEQKTIGGRGYALASDTSRRAREAAFLPVQSPTEIHLRHLLAEPDEDEYPRSRT